MNILEVTENSKIIGYRIIQGDDTIDILTNKICSNMSNYLKMNKTGIITAQDSRITTEKYSIAHKDRAILQELYNKFHIQVNKNTLYVTKGALTIHAKKYNNTYTIDIITNNTELKEELTVWGLLDTEDVNNNLEIITDCISEDILTTLISTIPLIYCRNNTINIYTEKGVEGGTLNLEGFIYNTDDTNEIIYNKELTIIRLEG